MAKSIYLEDLRAAIEEADNIQRILKEKKGPKGLHLFDFLSEITNPQTNCKIVIGQEARKCLLRVARLALKRDKDLKRRVAVSTMLKATSEQLAIFLTDGVEPLNSAAAEKIVAGAVASVRSSLAKEMTHYFPCIISRESSRYYFAVGPVMFFKTEFFLIDKKEKFDLHLQNVKHHWRKGAAKPSPFESSIKDKTKLLWPSLRVKKQAEEFVQDAKDYLAKYRWVASVKVGEFDKQRSAEVAQLCVETALNIARLFIGASHAEKFRIGGQFRKEQRGLSLTEDESGKLTISHSTESEEAQLGPNWIEKTLEGRAKYWVELAGSLIEALRSGRELPILYYRYVIALWWYGEAVSEPHNHAKIVRYATAMEAFLGSPIKKGPDGAEIESLSTQLARRAAFLCARGGASEISLWQTEVKAFYNVRSRLVHGDYAPFDPDLDKYVGMGERLVGRVLIEGLAWTSFLANRDHSMSITRISKYFDRVLPRCPLTEANPDEQIEL